jgi:hypothetical protein
MKGMNGQGLMLLYSAGVVLIFGTFVLLHLHARRQRAALGLDAADLLTLRFKTRAHLISMSLGFVSIAIALANPGLSGIAGIIYALMGPLHAWNGYQAGKAHSDQRKAAGLMSTVADPES